MLYLQADILLAGANAEEAEAIVAAALDSAQRVDDQETVCQSLSLLGVIHGHRGEIGRELEFIERALTISQASGNRWREA
ncbi:MAG: tetratricopeptide repeat protein, partial [Caldilineaceae bacterium]|nr:tetratricopeptide repeat protein [Caldilineaceae bacterium]